MTSLSIVLKKEGQPIMYRVVLDLICKICSFVNGLIGVFGVAANIINIVVFIKQGFSDTIHVSLLSLAVADLMSVAFLVKGSFLTGYFILCPDIPWLTNEVAYVICGGPHETLARAAGMITVFITFEKCLCIVTPFDVKRIVTTKVTIAVMVSIYAIVLIKSVPEYITKYLGWKWSEKSNRTLLGIIFQGDIRLEENISYPWSMLTQIGSFAAVAVFSAIISIRLSQSSKWREVVSSGNVENSKNSRRRNDRTVKIVLLVAIIYIICFLPSVIVFISAILIPDFSISGRFQMEFMTAWAIAFLFDACNSSSTILVYLTLSSNFRATCYNLFKNAAMKTK